MKPGVARKVCYFCNIYAGAAQKDLVKIANDDFADERCVKKKIEQELISLIKKRIPTITPPSLQEPIDKIIDGLVLSLLNQSASKNTQSCLKKVSDFSRTVLGAEINLNKLTTTL